MKHKITHTPRDLEGDRPSRLGFKKKKLRLSWLKETPDCSENG